MPNDQEKSDNQIDADSFNKIKEQVENLNKGIAGYRDQISSFKEENQTLKEEIDALKDKKETGEKVELSSQDQARLEGWAKKQGFITEKEMLAEKQRIYQDTQKSNADQAINEFLTAHPEYNADEEWKKIQKEFVLYKAPSSFDGYRTLLSRIHKELNGGKDIDNAKNLAKAEISRNQRLSLGGGGGAPKGSDATVEDMQKRYPNLSRDQIESRLEEIKSLYPEKKV